MPCRNAVKFIVLFVVWASLPVLIMDRYRLGCPSPEWVVGHFWCAALAF
jgi:hypothetical protein